jgi:membrane protease YdiL (CAAX protease family)
VVFAWVWIGWVLRLDANGYLVLGVPIVVAFQLFIARRPLAELWLRPAPPFRLDPRSAAAAVLFMIFPAIDLVQSWSGAPSSVRLWSICATVGALPLGWAIAQADRRTWMALLLCLVIVAPLQGGELWLYAHARHHAMPAGMNLVRIIAVNFLLYLPVCFVIEEVFFRGAIDSFVQREDDRHGWATALFVSALWGWWHLGIMAPEGWPQFAVLVVLLPLLHLVPGVAFSYVWRRTGSLLPSAAVHSFIDSFRNAMT